MQVTKPGYQVVSSSFVARFVAGNREELEERRNWHDLMMCLLCYFEDCPRDMAIVGFKTADWIVQSIRLSTILPTFNTFLDMNIRNVSLHISNDLFFRQPGDRIKKTVVHVHLEDYKGIQSILTFEVKKKQETEMKRLRTLAAETMANNITRGGDIDVEYLGVLPKHLIKDIKKEYNEFLRVDRRPISISKSLETGEGGMNVGAGSHRT